MRESRAEPQVGGGDVPNPEIVLHNLRPLAQSGESGPNANIVSVFVIQTTLKVA